MSGGRRYLALLGLSAAAALALGAAGWLPTRNLAGGDGVNAMWVALALCWLASAVGAVPVLLAERETARPPVASFFGSMLTRLMVLVGATAAVALSGTVAPRPLLLWTAIAYALLLAVDTWYLLSAARGGGTGEAGHGKQDDAARDETRQTERP